jgi:hypothetical protein
MVLVVRGETKIMVSNVGTFLGYFKEWVTAYWFYAHQREGSALEELGHGWEKGSVH